MTIEKKYHSPLGGESLAAGTVAKSIQMPDLVGHDRLCVINVILGRKSENLGYKSHS